MYPLPKYFSLQQQLLFQATIRTEILTGNTRSETRVSYPLTFGPAKQDWGSYCLSVKRGATQYSGYTPNAADEVAELLAQPLRHLEITFDTKGNALKLRNHAAIWNQWREETAPAVRSAYTGEWVERLIVQTESVLFDAPTLLQMLLQRDAVLHNYFSVLQWLAGGRENLLPPVISGVKIDLPYNPHFEKNEDGTTSLNLTAIGRAPGTTTHWKKLLSQGKSDSELLEPPNLKNIRWYTLPAGSLWPVKTEAQLEITAGENLQKNRYLQLLLL